MKSGSKRTNQIVGITIVIETIHSARLFGLIEKIAIPILPKI